MNARQWGSPPQPPQRRHSTLGVASFTLALCIPALLLLLVILALALGLETRNAPGWYMFWAFIICGLLAPLGHLVGLILGVVDVLRSKSKRLFPVLGITLNTVLGVSGLFILIYLAGEAFKALGAFH